MIGEARGQVAVLPRPVWRVLAADAFSAVGSGLTLPFLVVYLHQARGLGLGEAGVAAACLAVAGLVGNPAGGWLADRVGPSRAVVVGLVIAAAGAVLLAGVTRRWQAFPAAALAGLGTAIAWPAQDALLARLAGAAGRSTVFALRHLTLNLGLGTGAGLAALLVDGSRPTTFVALYVLDAVSFVLAALVLLSVPAGPSPSSPVARARGGYRELVRDVAFVQVWVLAAALITVGYGAFSMAFPAVATGAGRQSAAVLGLAYGANTITVVVAQLGVLRLLAGWRRTRAMGWAATVWAGTWLLVLVGAWVGGSAGWFVAAAITFAVGETLLTPSLPAIVNDLAPEELRGCYNGGLTLAYTAGFVAGPLLCGLVLDGAGGPGPLCVALIVGCGGCAALAAHLGRRLPSTVNLVPEPTEAHVPAQALTAVRS